MKDDTLLSRVAVGLARRFPPIASNSPLLTPHATTPHPSHPTPLGFPSLQEPLERLDDPAGLDPQWDVHPAFQLRLAVGAGAGHPGGEELALREPLLALLPQSGGVGLGEAGRVGQAFFALVGLGEHQGHRLARPRVLDLLAQFGQVAGEFHGEELGGNPLWLIHK